MKLTAIFVAFIFVIMMSFATISFEKEYVPSVDTDTDTFSQAATELNLTPILDILLGDFFLIIIALVLLSTLVGFMTGIIPKPGRR